MESNIYNHQSLSLSFNLKKKSMAKSMYRIYKFILGQPALGKKKGGNINSKNLIMGK